MSAFFLMPKICTSTKLAKRSVMTKQRRRLPVFARREIYANGNARLLAGVVAAWPARADDLGSLFSAHATRSRRASRRWDTDDGDFIDLVRLNAPPGRPHLVILHGLEGTARSHYARGLFLEAARRGWAADLLLFRGCGGELNRAPRFYHSGETGDIDAVAQRLLQSETRRAVPVRGRLARRQRAAQVARRIWRAPSISA